MGDSGSRSIDTFIARALNWLSDFGHDVQGSRANIRGLVHAGRENFEVAGFLFIARAKGRICLTLRPFEDHGGHRVHEFVDSVLDRVNRRTTLGHGRRSIGAGWLFAGGDVSKARCEHRWGQV